MTLATHLLGLATATLAAFPSPAGACAPVQAGASVAEQPEAWRRAVAELVAATATEGQLWSCSAGVVELRVHPGGATLTVVGADGRSVSREVVAPEEVTPLGEALLARLPPAAGEPPPAEEPPTPAAEAPPRALVSLLIGPRYAGRSNVLLGTAGATAVLPFGKWTGGLWGRFSGTLTALDHETGPVNEVCFGAVAGRNLALPPLELRISLLAGLAVDNRDLGPPKRDARPLDSTHLDGRFGLEARALLPITKLVRAVVALDADLGPHELGEGHRPEHGIASLPAYTFGLALGVELAPR